MGRTKEEGVKTVECLQIANEIKTKAMWDKTTQTISGCIAETQTVGLNFDSTTPDHRR